MPFIGKFGDKRDLDIIRKLATGEIRGAEFWEICTVSTAPMCIVRARGDPVSGADDV